MQTTTIVAPDTRAALQRVTEVLGPDAVIVRTRKVHSGVEVVAGVGWMPPLAPAFRPGIPKPMFSAPPAQPDYARQPDHARQTAAQTRPDPMVRFIAQARAVGVDPELLSDELAVSGDDLADVWSRFLVRIDEAVQITPPPHRDLGHLCVVGDSGSAKTTTLAQIAAQAKAADPKEPIGFIAGDRRPGAREQMRVIARMLGIALAEPRDNETLAEAVMRLGGNRRLFIDMPSDPRLAACDVEEMRKSLGRGGGLTVLCTLPLNGQLARHRQIASLFGAGLDGYVLTHASEMLPPGAALHMLLENGVALAGIGAQAEFAAGLQSARVTSLARMVAASLSGGSAALQ